MATTVRDFLSTDRSPTRMPLQPTVGVVGDQLRVNDLLIVDRNLAEFVRSRPESDWPQLVVDAFKVGLLALTHAGVTVNVDYVQKEFERLTGEVRLINQQAGTALVSALRENFGDGGGKLPRTMEAYLGSEGRMAQILTKAADPTSRSSLVGQMQLLLGSHFDGDTSKLAELLDPAREGAPLHPMHVELRGISDRLVAVEAATKARQQERERGTAKGGDHEDAVEPVLGRFAADMGDALESVAHQSGLSGCLKGDFVLTLNPAFTGGLDAKVVIETKDTKFLLTKIEKELTEARQNRGANIAVAVYSPGKLPEGFAPLTMHGSDLYCEFDPHDVDHDGLLWGIRLARIAALRSVREATVQVDAQAVRERVGLIRRQLQVIKAVKTKVASIGKCADEVGSDLSEMRSATEVLLTEIESELRMDAAEP